MYRKVRRFGTQFNTTVGQSIYNLSSVYVPAFLSGCEQVPAMSRNAPLRRHEKRRYLGKCRRNYAIITGDHGSKRSAWFSCLRNACLSVIVP
jgi:hypothetical protein